MKRLCFFLLLFSISLGLIGCDSGVKVSGKIQFADGTPLSNGKVFFISGITQAEGKIGENGAYSLFFSKPGRGVPPGEYTVLVTGAFFQSGKSNPMDEMDTGTRPMIDSKFAETETTPLHCTVPGKDGYDFIVEPSKEYILSSGKK